jgi:YHS domain-containing protein/mono/diheme cytochrome c family protein
MLLLHLPVGLLAGVGVFEGVALARKTAPAPRLLVGLAALAAVFAATSGLVLHLEPDYTGDTLYWHKRLGIGVAIGSVLVLLLHATGRTTAYRLVLAATLGVLVPAGHYGAAMTHGEGFLTAPLHPEPEPAEPPVISAPDPVSSIVMASYEAHVAPLLTARCNSCHGEKKKKGGLRLDTPDFILKGGRGGDALIAGVPAESEIMLRLALPLDDEDHMPPEHKKQLTDGEVALLDAWIAAGASFDNEFELGPGLALPAPPAVVVEAEPAALAAAPAAPVEALRARLIHVQPVAAGTHELWIDFAAPATAMGDAEVKELLTPLAEHVAELSLSRTTISDATLGLLSDMPRLRRLDLRSTAITEAGLERLRGHETLEELVLAQTKLTDAALDALLDLPALKKVWLWQSGMSPEGVARLRAERPQLAVDAGDAAAASALDAEGDLVFSSDAPSPDAVPPPAGLEPINTVCPVTGNPVNAKYSVVFEGRVVAFCCPNCPKEFWTDPEKYRAELK